MGIGRTTTSQGRAIAFLMGLLFALAALGMAGTADARQAAKSAKPSAAQVKACAVVLKKGSKAGTAAKARCRVILRTAALRSLDRPSGKGRVALRRSFATSVAANPDLAAKCGLNVMVVLDESTSIANTGGATTAVRNAATAFLTGLKGTGSQVAMIEFSTRASKAVGYTTVTDATITSTFTPYITNTAGSGNPGYNPTTNPTGWTNWEDAFIQVKTANSAGTGWTGAPKADLVVFITDGDPTAYNNGSNVTTGTDNGTVATALDRAIIQANLVKGQGSHVFAVGVGAAIDNATSEGRLKSISGTEKYPAPQSDFTKADYMLVSNFGDLENALTDLATQLCKSSVTITKQVDQGSGYQNASGWTFGATVTPSTGAFTWSQPAGASGASASTQTTAAGTATFQWQLSAAGSPTASVTVAETQKSGFEFVDVACKKNNASISVTQAESFTLTGLGKNDVVTCTVRNRKKTSIELTKVWSGPAGQTTLAIGTSAGGSQVASQLTGANGAAPLTTGAKNVVAGTYYVSEPSNADYSSALACTRNGQSFQPGANNQVTLVTGDQVVCTFTNTRLVPDLKIVKTAPASVTLGDAIPYTIQVSHTATSQIAVAKADVKVTDPAVTGSPSTLLEYASGDTNSNQKLDLTETWAYKLAGGATPTLPTTSCASVDNTALVAAAPAETVTSNNSSSVRTIVKCFNLKVVKDANAASVTLDASGTATATYTVTVTNLGNQTVTLGQIALTDPNAALKQDNPAITSLAPGASATWTATQAVTSAACATGKVTNTATVGFTAQSGLVDHDTSDNSDGAETAVVCNNLTIVKTASPATVTLGPGGTATATYTVTVTNNGNQTVPVSDIAIGDATATLAPAPGNPVNLAPGASASWTASQAVTTAACETKSVSNTATVSFVSGKVDYKGSDNESTASVAVKCFNLKVVKSAKAASVTIGADGTATATYSVVVTNLGNTTVPVADFAVTDLTAGLTEDDASVTSLAPGASKSWTAKQAVTTADCRTGTVENTASVAFKTESQLDYDTADNKSTASTGVKCFNLKVVKSAKDTFVTLDGTGKATATYTVTVTNLGNTTVPVSSIDLVDATAGVTLTEDDASVTSLAPGASKTWTATQPVGTEACAPGKVENTATVAFTKASEIVEYDTKDNSSTASTGVKCFNLKIVKTADAASVTLGADGTAVATYTITVTNLGNQDVAVADVALTDLDASAVPVDPAQTVITKNGGTKTWTATQKVDTAACIPAKVENTATVAFTKASEIVEYDITDNKSTASTGVKCFNLKVVKSAKSASVTLDGTGKATATYTITVTNLGNTTVPVSSIDLVDDTATLKQDTPSVTELAPGASTTWTASQAVTPKACASGEVKNTVTVGFMGATADVVDYDANDNTSSAVVGVKCFNLKVVKTPVEPTVTLGSDGKATASYTITVTNLGNQPVAVADIGLSDPAAATLTEDVPAQDTIAAGGTKTWTATQDVTAEACGAKSVENTATVGFTGASELADYDTTDNSSTATVGVKCFGLKVVKTVDSATALVGDTLTYTVTITNVGNTPVDPATVAASDKLNGVDLPLGTPVVNDGGNGLIDPAPSTDSIVYTVTHKVAADECAGLTNVASAGFNLRSAIPEADKSDNTSSVTTKVACVDLAKTSDKDVYAAGDTQIVWTVTAKNTGSLGLDVPTPTDARVALTGPTSDLGADDVTAVFQPGETLTWTATETIDRAGEVNDCGTQTNSVEVALTDGKQISFTRRASKTVQVTCVADYVITKTPSASVIDFGKTVSYTIEITHIGDNIGIDFADKVVTDTFAGETPVVLARMSDTGNGDGILQKGETWTYGIADPSNETVSPVTRTATTCDTIVNTATVAVTPQRVVPEAAVVGGEGNHSSTATVNVNCVPDLAIAKTGPAQVSFGDTITYGVSVTSIGDPLPIPAAQIRVSDPSVSPDPLVLASGDTNTDNLLQPGETWVYSLAGGAPVARKADACGTIPNTATVSIVPGELLLARAAEANTANNSASVTTTVLCTLDLGITKTSDKAGYAPGESATYTVTVTNNGQQAVPFGQIQVSDPLAPLTLVGAAPAELAPGASVSYTGTRAFTAADCGTFVNTATVTYTGPNGPETTTANNTATRSALISGAACQPVIVGKPDTKAKLSIVKRGPLSVIAGQLATYRITVKNVSRTTATKLVITDTLPSGLTLAKKVSGGSLRSGVVSWSVGSLKSGASKTVRITLRAGRQLTGQRCNVGSARASNAGQVRDRACTTVKAVAAANQPAVTG